MRISLAQIDSHIGNFEGNLSKILHYITLAKAAGADIVVFPELATCGYPPRDFLEFNDFIKECDTVLHHIRMATDGIAVLIGSPAVNPDKNGKDLHNAAFFIADQKIIFQHNKTLLPTYDIFDEYRYFEPSHDFNTFMYKGFRIALTVCEDLWNLGNENPLYTVCPLDKMIDQNPDLIFNISASPFAYDHAQERIDVVQANVKKYKKPLFYCNTVGAQTDVVFDGGSLVFTQDGTLLDELPYFQEVLKTYEVIKSGNTINTACLNHTGTIQSKEKFALIHDAILLGIRDYFGKLGFKSAVLGLSGGIDSALTCALAVEALGKENVMGLMMPSRFSSKGSVDDAVTLAKNLGIRYEIIEIEPMYEKFLLQLKPVLEDRPFNVTEENIQARVRGTLLMAASNKLGHILLNTTNKSEMSVGYGTLYGDLCGGLSVLGDVYKTEVYRLVDYVNKHWPTGNGPIPQNSISKPPSAELRPGQKDSDSLPPYDILDPILFQYIEKRQGPQEIIAKGNDSALVKRILRMVNINEFKREQTAPVIRVSPKAFGIGRRMPIVGKYLG